MKIDWAQFFDHGSNENIHFSWTEEVFWIVGSRLEPFKTQKFELTQASRTHCSYVVHWSVPLTTRDSYHDPVPGAAPPTSDTRRRLLLSSR